MTPTARTPRRTAGKLGLWRDAGDYRPQRGDQILFDWTGWGGCDHIGTVVGTDDGYRTVWCVEGNAGSPNGVHYIRRDWTYIRGFVALSTVAQPQDEEDFLATLNEDEKATLLDAARRAPSIDDNTKNIGAVILDGLGNGNWEDGARRFVRAVELIEHSGGGSDVAIDALAEAVAAKLAERLQT